MFIAISPTIKHVILYILAGITISTTISHVIHSRIRPRGLIMGGYSKKENMDSLEWISFLVLTVVILISWLWISFAPLSIGHLDEISYLNKFINPQVWSGRFFPLGHLEFNLIYPSKFGGALWPMYILPFLQLMVFIWCVNYILRPASVYLRVLSIALSYWLSAVIPMAHLIIPERNAIFFLLLGLCFFKRYTTDTHKVSLYCSLISIGLSLYYKEPMFSFVMAFAVVHFIYSSDLRLNKNDYILSKTVALEFGMFFLGLFFLLGYYLFVLAVPAQAPTYMGISIALNIAAYIGRAFFFIWDLPLLPVFFTNALIAHFYIDRSSRDRELTMGLIAGGTAYFLVLATLNMPVNGYYYSIPYLSITLCYFFCVKHLLKTKSVTVSFLLLFLTIIFSVVIYSQSKRTINDIFMRKNIQEKFLFISKAIDANSDIKRIFYIIDDAETFPDYLSSVLEQYLYKFKGVDSFFLASKSGCYSWNEYENGNKIHCVKKEFGGVSDYDLVIIENKTLTVPDASNVYTHISPFINTANGQKEQLTMIFKNKKSDGNDL